MTRPPAEDARAAEAQWSTWREGRLARLRGPEGWLALVGLSWLTEGENRVDGLPGAFVVVGGAVTLRARPADGYTLGGAAVAERALRTDAVKPPDRLRLGTRTAMVIQRGPALAVRIWDAASPALQTFRGVEAFPFDLRWRIAARWDPYPSPREVEQPSSSGPPQRALAPGRARFEVGGRAFALEPTLEDDGSLQFLFKDATAPRETYGGGRFLAARAPEGGGVELDFNRAYSPPCAFTAFATCPLPGPENVLPVRIEAGEKSPVDH
jgi:uncharacterized protein (DUF1684 family)